jgi:hypothetical protein
MIKRISITILKIIGIAVFFVSSAVVVSNFYYPGIITKFFAQQKLKSELKKNQTTINRYSRFIAEEMIRILKKYLTKEEYIVYLVLHDEATKRELTITEVETLMQLEFKVYNSASPEDKGRFAEAWPYFYEFYKKYYPKVNEKNWNRLKKIKKI